MSSSKASKSVPAISRHASSVSRRTALRSLAIGLFSGGLAAGLAGCGEGGFRPQYGTLGGTDVGQKMTHVDFAPIPGRNGQRIRNELIFKAYDGGTGAAPKYRLEIAIRESSTSTLVLQNGTSAGQVFQIDARFQLVDVDSKKVLLEGMSQSRASYDRVANAFSNVRAGYDAQERAAKTIANDINSRIAAFLSTVRA